MNSEHRENQQSITPAEPVNYSVPWKPIDNWVGVIMLAVIDLGLLLLALQGEKGYLAQSGLLVIIQLAYLLPVIIIFAWRRINWKYLGFGKFKWSTLGIGCGLLIASYVIILLHNLILMALGVETQGDGSSWLALSLPRLWRKYFSGVFSSRVFARSMAGSMPC